VDYKIGDLARLPAARRVVDLQRVPDDPADVLGFRGTQLVRVTLSVFLEQFQRTTSSLETGTGMSL
jgi:hypothetical protein